MLTTLRILFTVISAVCVAAIFPVGMFLGWGFAGGCGLFAVLFFVLMLLCKQSQDFSKEKTERFDDDGFISATNDDEKK